MLLINNLTMPNRKRKAPSNDIDPITKKVIIKDHGTVLETNQLYWPFDHIALLGRGSFGNVQLFYHHTKGHLYAGKLFKNETEYTKELSLLKMFHHENVIECVHSLSDTLTIILKVYTINLEELVTRNVENHLGLSQIRVMSLIRDMTRALVYLVNERAVVHRDIKPSNIMFDDLQEMFILTDFGMANTFDRESLTIEEPIAGTIDFMRPDLIEQLQSHKSNGVKQSIHTDLWSLALTFFFSATGRHPYKPVRSKLNWIGLAQERPDGCLWMKLNPDNTAEYHITLDGYNRMENQFLKDVFEPLLISLMRKDIKFSEYFEKARTTKLDGDIVYVFDVTNMKMHTIQCDSKDKSLSALLTKLLNGQTHFIVHKNEFLTNQSRVIPKTSFDEPLLVCKETNIESKTNLQKILEDLFATETAFIDKTDVNFQQFQCLCSIVLKKFELIQKYLHFIRQTSVVHLKFLNNLRTELETRFQMFDCAIQDFFRAHLPNQDFRECIDKLKEKVNTALLPLDVYSEDKDNLAQNIFYFKQHLDFFDHQKLGNKRDQIQQTKRAMKTAMDTLIQVVTSNCLTFNNWLKYANERVYSLQESNDEIAFASEHLNGLIISEVSKVGT